MTRHPLYFNVYRGDTLLTQVMDAGLPPVVPSGRIEDVEQYDLNLLNLLRVSAVEKYTEAHLCYVADVIDIEAVKEAIDERVQTCVDYIAEYVEQVVEKDTKGKEHTPASRLLVMHHSADVALRHLAEAHPDRVVRHLAHNGRWGFNREGLSYGGLLPETPELADLLPNDPESPSVSVVFRFGGSDQ